MLFFLSASWLSFNRDIFTHQQLVVHSLDDDFLGRVLRNVEAQLQHLAVTLVLDEGTVEAVQPGMVVLRTQRAAVLSGLLRGGAVIGKNKGPRLSLTNVARA